MSGRDKRITWLTIIGMSLIYLAFRFSGCDPAHAQRRYAPGDTVKIGFGVNDTLSIASHPSSDSVYIYRWFGITRTQFAVATKAASIRPGAEGYYWISGADDIGDFVAYWVGVVDSRTPIAPYNFYIAAPDSSDYILSRVGDIVTDVATLQTTVEDSTRGAVTDLIKTDVDSLMRRVGVPTRTIADDIDDIACTDLSAQVDTLIDVLVTGAGPYTTTLRIYDTSDTSAIQSVWVKIMDEDQVGLHYLGYSNSSGEVVTALPADTAQVICWLGGSHTFTVPSEIIVTASGLTDTIWGTPITAAAADSANTTCVEARLRALDASESEGVIVTAEVLSGEDLGSPASNPSYIVVRQAVMDTTDSDGYFKLCLFSSDELLPEGGSAGIYYKFSFSKAVRIGPRFISESDTLYLPTSAGTYNYWNPALRP